VELIDQPYDQENDEGDDQKINDRVDEQAVVYGSCTSLLCFGQTGVVASGQIEKKIGKVNPTQQHTDRWHHDVVDQRGHNRAECSANNNGYRQIDDVTTIDEIPEFF
jgi:hypothetical protein